MGVLRGFFLLFIVLVTVQCNQKIGSASAKTDRAAKEQSGPVQDEPEKVIFDTDVGGDVDDAGALAVLHALADKGEIEILAIGVVIGHEAAVPYVDAVNTWYGRPNLPVGTMQGAGPYARDEFMVKVVPQYPYKLTKATAPDVVKVYRKVLAAQADKSVILVAVGPATNIANLLKSQPDEYSNLNGVELVRKKVKFYSAPDNGSGGLPNGKCGFNYRTDISAGRTELELLPADFPIVYAGGSGLKLEMGAELNKSRPDHIIRKSYEAYYKGVAKSRFTWDQLRVLYGCRPSIRKLWDTSPPGNIELSTDGIISYTTTPNKNRAYAYIRDFEGVRAALAELMTYDPRDK